MLRLHADAWWLQNRPAGCSVGFFFIIMPIAYYQMLAEEIRHSLVTFKILSQYRPPFL